MVAYENVVKEEFGFKQEGGSGRFGGTLTVSSDVTLCLSFLFVCLHPS